MATLPSSDTPNTGSIYRHDSGAMLRVERTENGKVTYHAVENTKLNDQTEGQMPIEDFNKSCIFVRRAA